MKIHLATSILTFSLAASSVAEERITFANIVDHIRASGDNRGFDSLATAKELAEVATTEQLASFLGEESLPLQLCAVQALGAVKKDPAVVLFLGSKNPEIKGAVAKSIIGPPLMEMNLPQLAKSLEYGPTDPLFVEPALKANRLLGTPDCSTRLALYATFSKAKFAMREKALEELLTFETFSPQTKPLIETLKLTLAPPEGVQISSKWVHLIAALVRKSESPFTQENFDTYTNTPLQDEEIQQALIAELLSQTEDDLELFRTSESRKIRQAALARWFETKPQDALKFANKFLLDHLYFHPELTTRQREILQDILLNLAKLDNEVADKQLSQSFLAIIERKLNSKFFWLEFEEVLALRGDAISKEARESFQTHLTAASEKKEDFPERAYPTLLAGGDPNRGRNIMHFKKARCTECHSFPPSFFPTEQRGPNLSPGQSGSPARILRSLVAPDHDLAFSYRDATFNLKDGSQRKGRIVSFANKKQGPLFYEFVDENGELQTILTELVETITYASPMPSALDNLSHREIRDVVAYLTKGLDASR